MKHSVKSCIVASFGGFLRPLKEERRLYVFCLLMMWLTALSGLLLGIRGAEFRSSLFFSLLSPLGDAYVLCLAAWLLSRVRLGWAVRLAAVALYAAEMFVLLFNHSLLSSDVVNLLVETDAGESSEFLLSALTHPSLWVTLVLVLTSAFASWSCCRIAGRYVAKQTPRRLMCGALAGASLVGLVLQAGIYVNLWRCFRLDNLDDFELSEYEPRLYTPAVRLSYGVAVNRTATKELDELVGVVERTEVKSCSFRSPLIVLIIGESYNKHHASLYNPRHRSTTPRLEALRDEGRLWVFSDVVTPYNHTTAVFREMFSTWDRSCRDSRLDHTLFPAVFRKAGYDVWLFSNQFVQKNADVTTEAKLNIVGGTIFNHSHLSALQFTRRNTNTKEYDGELLDMVPTADENRPTLLIVHLKGQHVDYGERYPEDRVRYRPEDYEAHYGGRTEQEVHAHYDNATLYNDSVVATLMGHYDKREAIAIYLSDHGEEVYDWRNQYVRTSDPVMSWGEARNQYEVPFVVYMSELYEQRHPDIAEGVEAARERPFVSTDICHMLFGLAGIETKEYKPSLDLLSPHYVAPERIIDDKTDYDALRRESTNK